MNEITRLGPEELLCQLAEEASELSQAALKLRKAITGKNPTPKTTEQCISNYIEELADIYLIIEYLNELIPVEMITKKAAEIMLEKEQRWINRLKEVP